MKNKLVLIISASILTCLSIFAVLFSSSRLTHVFAVAPNNAPTYLTATPKATNAITLTWTDNATNEIGYKIDRASNDTFTYGLATQTVVGYNLSSYNYTYSLSEGSGYYFRVYAYNNDGISGYSNTVFGISYLKTPTNLAVSSANQSANLSWTDVSSRENNYVVERKAGVDGQYETIGTLPAGSTSYSDTSMGSAHYYYRVKATRTNGSYSLYSNEVDLNVDVPASLNKPTNLVLTVSDKINLRWDDASIGEQGYKIERSTTEGGDYTEIGSTASDVTTFADANFVEGTLYYYRVRAFNGSNFSEYSDTGGINSGIRSPSNLTASAIEGTPNVTISWQDNSSIETGYKIERKPETGSWEEIAGDIAANSTQYSDKVDYNSLTYLYRVSTIGLGLTSAPSNEATARLTEIEMLKEALAQVNEGDQLLYTVKIVNHSARQISDIQFRDEIAARLEAISTSEGEIAGNVVSATLTLTAGQTKEILILTRVPYSVAAPTNFSASVTSEDEIDLHWVDNYDYEDGFFLERSTNPEFSENLTPIMLQADTDAYNDQNLLPSTRYYYRIRAYRSTDYSDYSSVVSAVTLGGISIDTPIGLSASSLTSTQVVLQWQDQSDNEQGFKIERSLNQTFTSDVQTFETGAGTTQYIDNTVVSGTVYFYRVRAFSGDHYSDYSNIFQAALTVPQKPSNLSAQVYHISNVQLTWKDNSNNEYGFVIERSTTPNFSVNLSEVALVNPDVSSYVDLGLQPNRTYYYRVASIGGLGNSDFAVSSSVTPLLDESIPVPTNVRILGIGQTEIGVTWDYDPSVPVDCFYLERTKASDFDDHAEVNKTGDCVPKEWGGGVMIYLDPGTTYQIRVRAIRFPDYASGYGNQVTATTSPASMDVPVSTNLQASLSSDFNSVEIRWQNNHVHDETCYAEMQISRNSDFSDAQGPFGFEDEGEIFIHYPEELGVRYYYRLRIVKRVNESFYYSEWSDPVSFLFPNPDHLTATLNSSNHVVLNWSDFFNDEKYFDIQRNKNSDFVELWGYNDISYYRLPNTTSLIDSQDLISGSTYYYRVRTYRPSGYTKNSNTVSVTIP